MLIENLVGAVAISAFLVEERGQCRPRYKHVGQDGMSPKKNRPQGVRHGWFLTGGIRGRGRARGVGWLAWKRVGWAGQGTGDPPVPKPAPTERGGLSGKKGIIRMKRKTAGTTFTAGGDGGVERLPPETL